MPIKKCYRASEVIKIVEKCIPKSALKKLQKEADLREYSDEEYADYLIGWLPRKGRR